MTIPQIQLSHESNSDPRYLELRDASFEIIVKHQRSLEYDHLAVRIGDKRYDFNPRQSGRGATFEVRPGDRTGFLFVRTPEHIESLKKLMESFVKGFNNYSFPPFATEPDWRNMNVAHSNQGQTGGLNYFEVLGRGLVGSPGGVLWPVENRIDSGVLNVEEVSCASSIIGLLNEYFGFHLYLGDGWEADAREVGQHLFKGNPGGTPPDAIMKY